MTLATLKAALATELKKFETAAAAEIPAIEAEALKLVDAAENEFEKLWNDVEVEYRKAEVEALALDTKIKAELHKFNLANAEAEAKKAGSYIVKLFKAIIGKL